MDIKDLPKEQRIFAIFAGPSGSGKSAAAASMPKPFQEIDTDLRANGIINAIDQGWLDPDGIDVIQFDPFKGFIPIESHLNNLYNMHLVNQFPFKSIDFGSGTSLVRLLNLTSLSIPKGSGIGHIKLADLAMTGPADYKFESQALHKITDFLRVFPCNITMSAHIVDRYGKPPGSKEGDPQIVIGEKLTLGTANLAENMLAVFNDVYVFSKSIIANEDKYFVEFNTNMAKNTFGIPPGKHDITRKSFWNYFQDLVRSIKDGTFKKPENTGGFLTL